MKKTSETEAGSLLGDSDGPAWEQIGVADGARVILVCDHASRTIPAALNSLGLDDDALQKHIAWDIGAAAVVRHLTPALNATAVLAGFSRLVIDCNRYPNDPSAIPVVSDHVPIPGNCNLNRADIERRRAAIRAPYHAAIRQQIEASEATGIAPALIAVHSFTPVMRGRNRQWQVGILWDTDARLPVPLMAALRSAGVAVGDNRPYSGRHPADFTIDHHGEERGLPHVSIELRQDLLATPAGVAHWAGLLADALRPILAPASLYTWQQ